MGTDDARIESLARTACRPFRPDRDYDDLLQEARIAAWRHLADPDGLVVTIARRRAIDTLRKRLDTLITDGVVDEQPTEDPIDPVLEYGLTGRTAAVAERVAARERYRVIGEELGVTESRISQIVRGLRDRVAP